MLDFLKSLFFPPQSSSETAKQRLRVVLLSDHLSLAPETVDALKRDLLEVISRYVEIDPAHADVSFEQREREVAMLANIPITGVRDWPRPAVPRDVAPVAAAAEPLTPGESSCAEPGVDEVVASAPLIDEPADDQAVLAARPFAQAPTKAAVPSPGHGPSPPARASHGGPPRRRRRKKSVAPAAAPAASPTASPSPG